MSPRRCNKAVGIMFHDTLSNLPTYFLSLFPLPARVEKRIGSLFRNLLWGGVGEEKKFHLVSWKKVCQPLDGGGLGIKDLKVFNKALLGKWLWRYHLESEALWKNVIDVKYGSLRGGWCSKASSGAYGVSLWKFIRKGWDFFSSNFRLKVGNGKRVLFWHDLWYGDAALKIEFPPLFGIARDQNAAVFYSYCVSNNKVVWNVIFKRDINDWEADEVQALLVKLYSIKLVTEREDSMAWSSAGSATISSYYRVMSSHGSCIFPWKSNWKVKVPPKVAFFCWVASLGKVLTTDNLRRRGLFIADWCVMCKKDGESVNHLFLHCEVSRFLWDEVLSWTGLHWVMPKDVVDLMVGWKGLKGGKKAASV
ncbi:hypothetical protein I3843_04G163600 [Carya illinoinensis]|nr:hypothetical protein I3843_04G163600 [Carya illinoinensis]